MNFMCFADLVHTYLLFPKLAKPLFRKGLQSQGKLLVKMLTLLTNLLDSSSLDDTRKFNQSLIALAETHNDRGVKSTEYGIVGEVLLWTLRKCLGSAYTPNIHMAWLRILSKILRVMVPVAVSLELNEGRAQEDRLDTLHTNYDSLYNCMEPSDVCTTEITDQRRASLDYAAYWAKQTRDKTNKITVLSNMK